MRFGQRAATLLVTLLLLTFGVFATLSWLPGEQLTVLLGDERNLALTPTERLAIRAQYSLDEPLARRYVAWLTLALRGDLGHSWKTGRPVSHELTQRLGATVQLNVAAVLLMLGIGLPLGWWLAYCGGHIDRIVSAALFVLYAAPTVWIALVLQDSFAVRWHVLPLMGRKPPSGTPSLADWLRHMVLPTACLSSHGLAYVVRFARTAALSRLAGSAVLVSRAAGIARPRVFVRHAVQPSLTAVAALVGLLVPALITGSVLIERIFAWPGVGNYFVDAIVVRDVPAIMGLTVCIGVLTICGSLLADLLGALLDPRLRPGEAGHL